MCLPVPRCVDVANKFATVVRTDVCHAGPQDFLKPGEVVAWPGGAEQLVQFQVAHGRTDFVFDFGC